MKDVQPRTVTFHEAIHILRYWLASKNIANSDKITVEIHFPNYQSQGHAMTEFIRELPVSGGMGGLSPFGSTTFEVEGVKVTFTNPDRLDRRVVWQDDLP